MLRLSTLAWILLALIGCPLTTSAQQRFVLPKGNTISTPAGPLTFNREINSNCGGDWCVVVRLGPRVLAHNTYAHLIGAYPTVDRPTFVAFDTSNGGNCCLPTISVVDVSSESAFELGGLFLASGVIEPTVKELGAGAFELTGDTFERNKLGDRLPTTYIYDRRRKLVWEKPEVDVPPYVDLVGTYPQDLLNDAERRRPLLRIVGDDAYRSFRDHISVAGPMSLEFRRWLFATGCLPHSCTSREGAFAIDVRTGQILAIQLDVDFTTRRPTVSIWSDIDPSKTTDLYGLRDFLNKWLDRFGAKLAEGAGPFRVVGAENAAGTMSGPPARRSSAPPLKPIPTWTNPNRSSGSSGPSFDCSAKPIATQPLAQLICRSDVLSYAELSYVIAYQAVRESLDPGGRKAMVLEANALVVALTDQCNIPKAGLMARAATLQEAGCIASLFAQEQASLANRATGPARYEVVLEPREAIAIQLFLQVLGFLPDTAPLDGVFGPTTRTAIAAWQRSKGMPDHGFGSKNMLVALMGEVTPPPVGQSTPSPPGERATPAARPQPLSMDGVGKSSAVRLILSSGTELRPQEVFEKAGAAVYVVETSTVQGSAVAISPTELLTNCHVVSRGGPITVAHEGTSIAASITSANIEADRCVLKAERNLPSWVRVRPYADIKVGERAYTIGAPQGLELSLAEGIVSSKRVLETNRLLQTSAPISKGSSGGGLFDADGNLMGITTFMLKDAQNLNFAIAAEEYAK